MRPVPCVSVIVACSLLNWGSHSVSAVTFTKDTLIPPDNRNYEGQNIVVDKCTVTIDGQHVFASIQVLHGGGITHSPRFTPVQDLVVEGDVVVDVASKFDASGKGYGPGTGPGRGGVGSSYGGGGGYGGAGGDTSQPDLYGALGGTTYGVVEAPVHFGSGGGQGSAGAGGAGGGAIRLSVRGTLTVDGAITANGVGGTLYDVWVGGGGGGSGGSIYLTVGTLAGAGQITANGGDGAGAPNTNCGGGGGGRVAMYTSRKDFFGVVSAGGGDGYGPGKEGTIHYGAYSPGASQGQP